MSAARPLPPLEMLKELIRYDPETGVFTWRWRPGGRVKEGKVAGRVNTDGYRRIGIAAGIYSAQRIAFKMMTGREPNGVIDHINGDRDDNRWCNLRDVPNAVNIQVSPNLPLGKTSKYRGVSALKPRGGRKAMWQASIKAFGVIRHLGCFLTEEDAAEAYEQARSEMHPVPVSEGAGAA